MPERPDLEYVVPILDREVSGKGIPGVQVDKPVVLRVALRDPVTVIVGRAIASVKRRAHFVILALPGEPPLELVVAPMLAGRFTLAAPAPPRRQAPRRPRAHPLALRRARAALPRRRADGEGLRDRRGPARAGPRARRRGRRRARRQGVHPREVPRAGKD